MLQRPELALLALAGYRSTQLLVHDSILDPVRARIDAWHQNKPESAVRTAVVTLVPCVYCTGWWTAGVLLAVWLLATGAGHDAPLLVYSVE